MVACIMLASCSKDDEPVIPSNEQAKLILQQSQDCMIRAVLKTDVHIMLIAIMLY